MKKGSGRDYEVGYCKPPKQHRFKPGQSGNRKGRHKKDCRSAVDRVAARRVRIEEGGESKMVPLSEGLLLKLVAMAMKGDKTAMRLALQYLHSHEKIASEGTPSLEVFINGVAADL